MNKFALFPVLTGLICAAPAVMAQSFAGGTIELSYATPTDTGGADQSVTEISGGLEFAVIRQFSIGVDAAGYVYEDTDISLSSATLHFVYHVNDAMSVGAFIGRDVISDVDSTEGLYTNVSGVEVGTEFGAAEIEGYLGQTTSGTENATLFGVDGRYGFGNNISAIAQFDTATTDSVDFQRVALGAEYAVNDSASVYGTFGQRSATAGLVSGDSNFIELGGVITFGTSRGTTFDPRSFIETFPNF